ASLEPAQTRLAEEPAGLAGDERVERDEPDRKILDDVLDESTVPRRVTMMGKRSDERVTVIVVAGNQVHGHRERCQQGAQTLVLRGAAGVDQVAGPQHTGGA